MLAPVNSQTTGLRQEAAAPQSVLRSARASDVAPVVVEKQSEPTPEQVTAATLEINQSLKLAAVGVQFEFDKEANTMIARVVDSESGEVIRQMPSEEMVRVSKALGKLQGLLVNHKV